MTQAAQGPLEQRAARIASEISGLADSLTALKSEVLCLRTDFDLPRRVLATALNDCAMASALMAAAIPLVRQAELEDERNRGTV